MKILQLTIISTVLTTANTYAQNTSHQLQNNTSGEAMEAIGSIVFSYDEAGNQVYRGYISTIINPNEPEVPKIENIAPKDPFWLGINIYPVPVKSTLTIAWNEENNTLIDNITLYQHSTMAFLFNRQNVTNLNRQIQIDMTGYYPGVYVLNFQLKDGRVLSHNILKE